MSWERLEDLKMFHVTPVTYGSRSKWTEQSHEVKGPIGLLCTSLAEHRAAITCDLEVYGWPTFAF